MMRITENKFISNFLSNINRSRDRLVMLQTQIATSKRVNKPSDDPEAANKIILFQSALDRTEQYMKNISEGKSFVDATSLAIDNFTNILSEVKELLVRAKNGTQSNELSIYAKKIDQLLDESVHIANTQFNGKYIFGGTQNLQPPFVLAADRSSVSVNPSGISGAIKFAFGEGVSQTVNINGQEAFRGNQIFTDLIQIRDNMLNGQLPTALEIQAISEHFKYVTDIGGKLGSINQTIDNFEKQIESNKVNLLKLLSDFQDADIAESIVKLKQEEMTLEAAMNVGARIIPKTLLDYLR